MDHGGIDHRLAGLDEVLVVPGSAGDTRSSQANVRSTTQRQGQQHEALAADGRSTVRNSQPQVRFTQPINCPA